MKFENLFEGPTMEDQKRDVANEFSVYARPVVAGAWRGRFNIPTQSLDINIVGHVSNKACMKVLEVVRTMPGLLCLEMIPRVDVWPTSFNSSPPTEQSVALFFFPDGRDEDVFDSLLSYAIYTDFALKAMIGDAELLIFTSVQLPGKLHRFQGKPYFWGAFNRTEHHVQSQNPKVRKSLTPHSGKQRKTDNTGSPKAISSKQSPSTDGAKTERRGRKLDDAWGHANPLDVLRQKAECRYCGFISSHGGISRLKAHLGGGHPRIRLPGCDKVSPPVKKVMSDWFIEWVRYTKALWTKEIRAELGVQVDEMGRRYDVSLGHTKPSDVSHKKKAKKSTALFSPETKGVISGWPNSLTVSTMEMSQAVSMESERRGRPLDGAWEHAKPLDEARQKTQCNHCGYVSSYGGISRLKAHLAGGSHEMQLEGCPHVPPQLKRVMEEWFNEWTKNSTATWTRKSHDGSGNPSKRGRPRDDTWDHAIPLDEMGEATRCKYCGYVSKRGGIARMKVHLAGGDPAAQLVSCPNVSWEVKTLMAAQGIKKYPKKSKGVPMENYESSHESQRKTGEIISFEKRHHILRETLDQITNSSVKDRLQKLIQGKSENLHEMQFEIQSLESQLASMP
ncbi:hypothetical protein ABFS82_03G087900 [Erythranthe guttata]